MEDIAASFLERMRRIQPDGPRRMIGYSFGGALAFEIAQQLTRAGEVVELLVFIDAFVPGSSRSKPLLGRMAVHFKRLTSGGIRGAFDHAARIAQSLHRRLLPHRIRTRQTILNQPSTLEEELQQIEGANRTAFRNYQPVPYKGDVVLFSATAKDPWRDFYTDDAHLHGWMPLVLGKFTVHSIPGTHYTLFDEPHVRTLARQLNGYLDRPAKKALDMRR
jgi:thioesterase domain-containing protein